MVVADKRQFPRARVEFPVTIEIDHGLLRSWAAKAIDISVDGVLLWSTRPLRLNVPFVLHFPFEWERAFAIVSAVWRQEYVYGCQFINLPLKVRKSLELAVLHYIQQDSPKVMTTLWRQL
jgi:hypothetical protein